MKKRICLVISIILIMCCACGCTVGKYKCIDCGKRTNTAYHTTKSLKNGDTVNVMCEDCAKVYWVEPFDYKIYILK